MHSGECVYIVEQLNIFICVCRGEREFSRLVYICLYVCVNGMFY